jgi:L,D-transpeptidase catalytic domain
MKRLALALAVSGALVSGTLTPASASFESPEAKSAASAAAALARLDMVEAFGSKSLKPGQYLWKSGIGGDEPARLVISLSDQLAYLYFGDRLVAVSTISSGTPKNPTPKGIFPILEKKRFHRSIKYDNAPMPFMQRLDKYGTALHGGYLPGYPASHGCIRLPGAFAAKLYAITEIGMPVLIGA